MAQRGNQLDRERFCCSLCLELLNNPVTLPCGHSYCSFCIRGHWDREDEKNSYSCPQCRKTFSPRPELQKNIMLADLVEELKKTEVRAAPADHCYAGAEDVACDVCTGRKMKALKSCLFCLASYCEEHLQPHYQSPPFKKHQLVEPSKNLQENICSQHDEVMKLFCRTDQKCICQICVDQHKGHQVVSAAAERKQKQEELERSGQEIQQSVQDREKDLKVLQQQVDAFNVAADKTVQDSEELFIQMIRLLEEGRSEVKQKIRSLQQQELRGVKEVQEKLQQEIQQLKRNHAELKQLLLTQDHNQFLLNWTSRSELLPSTASSSINVRPLRHFEDVTEAVSQLRASLQDLLTQTMGNISETLRPEPETIARSQLRAPQQDLLTQTMRNISETLRPEPKTIARSQLRAPQQDLLTQTMSSISETPRPEPKTRAEFLEYSQKIILDPNAVNRDLILSEGNRKVTHMGRLQPYPDHPDRFTYYPQVLSRESLTGCCYWEVEVGGGYVSVAVTYKSISRLGESKECSFGFNDKSWALNSFTGEFIHNRIRTQVSVPGPSSSSFRVGVFLDHRAGLLSFYRFSDPMTLIHRVQTTFTEPLHAGVRLYGSTAEFCKLK